MRFCQVSEILEWVEAFHEQIAKEYDRVKVEPNSERVISLLNYMADHERKLNESIKKFEIGAADEFLNTWSQECPPLELPESLEELHRTLSGKNTTNIIAQAIEFHDLLISAYKELTAAAEVESVKALFKDLADLEQNEKLQTIRDALYFKGTDK